METIDRYLVSSYAEFSKTATVTNYLPLLTERFARQRLQALARVEGHQRDGKPVVLFLCVHNAGRSQMALGFGALTAALRRARNGVEALNLTRVVANRSKPRCNAVMKRTLKHCIRRQDHPGPHRSTP